MLWITDANLLYYSGTAVLQCSIQAAFLRHWRGIFYSDAKWNDRGVTDEKIKQQQQKEKQVTPYVLSTFKAPGSHNLTLLAWNQCVKWMVLKKKSGHVGCTRACYSMKGGQTLRKRRNTSGNYLKNSANSKPMEILS